MIICGCRVKHSDHTFKPQDGSWGLCRICSHAIGAHKAGKDCTETEQILDLISNATSVKTISAMPRPEEGLGVVRLTLDLGLT